MIYYYYYSPYIEQKRFVFAPQFLLRWHFQNLYWYYVFCAWYMNVALWETKSAYVVLHSRLIGSWNNTKQQPPYGDGNWKILIPVPRGTWHNGTMGKAVRVRYSLDVGFEKYHVSLNAGTSLFRCCALGQCTSPSRASLHSGVNEYMF